MPSNTDRQKENASRALGNLAKVYNKIDKVEKEYSQKLLFSSVALGLLFLTVFYNDYKVAVAEEMQDDSRLPYLSFFAPGVTAFLDIILSLAAILYLTHQKKAATQLARSKEKSALKAIKNNVFLHKRLEFLSASVDRMLELEDFNSRVLMVAAWHYSPDMLTDGLLKTLLSVDDVESKAWILRSQSGENVKEQSSLSDEHNFLPVVSYSVFAHRCLTILLGHSQLILREKVKSECSDVISYSVDRVRLVKAKEQLNRALGGLKSTVGVFKLVGLSIFGFSSSLLTHNIFNLLRYPELRVSDENFMTTAVTMNNTQEFLKASLYMLAGSIACFIGGRMAFQKQIAPSQEKVTELEKKLKPYTRYTENRLLTRLCERVANEREGVKAIL